MLGLFIARDGVEALVFFITHAENLHAVPDHGIPIFSNITRHVEMGAGGDKRRETERRGFWRQAL